LIDHLLSWRAAASTFFTEEHLGEEKVHDHKAAGAAATRLFSGRAIPTLLNTVLTEIQSII